MRVLVIEDEVRQAASLKRGLEAEGFAVDVAGTGTDGLWSASEQQYDVILLDVMLPGLNGYKVCAALRAKEIWTPVLMLTAKDGELDEAEALDIGADDFLAKPFSFIVLVAHVRALLRRGGTARPAVLRVGSIELDLSKRLCTLDEVPVELTPREFSILEYLMRRRGDVVPKTEIIEHVWDFAYEGGDNVVEVHVSALRRKLGTTAIETVRGGGYRMETRGG